MMKLKDAMTMANLVVELEEIESTLLCDHNLNFSSELQEELINRANELKNLIENFGVIND